MSKSYHFTDIMFDLYKRQAKAKIIIDTYTQYSEATPLVKKECVECKTKIHHAHVINRATNQAICKRCYDSNQVVYRTLTQILNKFKRKEV